MIIRICKKIYNVFHLYHIRKKKNVILGKNVKIDNDTKIYLNKSFLHIGNNVLLRSNTKGYHAGMPFSTTILLDKEGSSCFIGDNCRINGAYLHAQNKIVIGRNTVIAAGVNILDCNGHVVNSKDRTQGKDNPEEIIIGQNVWIGLNAIILKGTRVGNNSIISAGSVVKGDFPENVIIQGNPALVKNKIIFN